MHSVISLAHVFVVYNLNVYGQSRFTLVTAMDLGLAWFWIFTGFLISNIRILKPDENSNMFALMEEFLDETLNELPLEKVLMATRWDTVTLTIMLSFMSIGLPTANHVKKAALKVPQFMITRNKSQK
jgi:hypothetical protein